jgi:hypothetical protein
MLTQARACPPYAALEPAHYGCSKFDVVVSDSTYRWNSISLKKKLCHFTTGLNRVAYAFCDQDRMINLFCPQVKIKSIKRSREYVGTSKTFFFF